MTSFFQCVALKIGWEVQYQKKDWIIACCFQYIKKKNDRINLKNVADVFYEANEERRRTFGIFCDTDFLELNVWSVDIFRKNNLLTLIDNFFFWI